MELSRHSFEKVVKDGLLTIIYENGKKYYQIGEIEAFMSTDTYTELVNGVVDPRNSLNDLTGKDWLPETKSFFYQKGLGAKHPEAQIEKLHPAPYSFQDVGHLVNFFTKRGMSVLDPFGGVGSTAKACEVNGRICTSIELSPVWHELSIKRLETEVGEGNIIFTVQYKSAYTLLRISMLLTLFKHIRHSGHFVSTATIFHY